MTEARVQLTKIPERKIRCPLQSSGSIGWSGIRRCTAQAAMQVQCSQGLTRNVARVLCTRLLLRRPSQGDLEHTRSRSVSWPSARRSTSKNLQLPVTLAAAGAPCGSTNNTATGSNGYFGTGKAAARSRTTAMSRKRGLESTMNRHVHPTL